MKWVIKQWRQLTTSAMHLVQKPITKIQCSDSSRSFTKEMRALKMRSALASHWKLTMTNWEQSLKLILLQLHEKFPNNSVDHSTIIAHLKQIIKVKKLGRWVPNELTTNQENYHFEVSSSLILCNSNKSFLDQIVTCDKRWVS